MPETDVTKMKVADLKRELKLRGLSTTGNKNELQDRLQTALIDGELSLEDTAISGEDLLDEDGVLTDEDEAKILAGDENELLKSPTTSSVKNTIEADLLALSGASNPVKKIVLKRTNSSTTGVNAGATVTTAKENTEPPKSKIPKEVERRTITVGSSDKTEKPTSGGGVSKVSQLSMKERMEMRAKKFGIAGGTSAVENAPDLDVLKKRAERFGCVVSSKMVQINAEEKLMKRKERFGNAPTSDVWAEKARIRLERFKTTSKPDEN